VAWLPLLVLHKFFACQGICAFIHVGINVLASDCGVGRRSVRGGSCQWQVTCGLPGNLKV